MDLVDWIPHPDYTDGVIGTGDLAIFTIDPPVTTKTLIELNLDASDPPPGEELTIIGFGRTSDGGSLAAILQEATVFEVPRDDCQPFMVTPIVEDTMICVWDQDPTVVSCGGMSHPCE